MPKAVMAFSFQDVRKVRQEGKYGIAQERGLGKSGKSKELNRISSELRLAQV
ncbi:hypothetical protein [Fundidesulfovibrio agrisoli]|uniref:hypothetical protein n=1 Tax=Fundidesulfovibrio agrisoli TaxID=2922717 RepID=UPI001FAD47E3|nr:hypothetical protein [Fundidesulfovibrio agrisoli]